MAGASLQTQGESSISLSDTINGLPVTLAANARSRYEGRMDDRAAVMALPAMRAEEFPAMVRDMFDRADLAAVEARAGRLKGQGGSTMTAVLYDPARQTLAIGSRGDSPAYLVFTDRETGKAQAHRISWKEDAVHGMPGAISNYLGCESQDFRQYDYLGTSPLYRERKDLARAPSPELDLAAWMEDLELDPAKTKVSLVIGSDGILPGRPTEKETDGSFVTGAMNALPLAGRVAEHLLSHVEKHNNDNATALVIDDLTSKHAGPIAALLCDGYGDKGAEFAEMGLEASQGVIREKKEEKMKNLTSESRDHYNAMAGGEVPLSAQEQALQSWSDREASRKQQQGRHERF